VASKLKLLVVSPGRHFKKNILPLFKESDINFEISAIVSRSGDSTLEFSNILVAKSLEEIDKNSFDCIYSSSPNKFHADDVRYAISINKHIMIEKPICTPGNQLSYSEISNNNIIVQEALMYKHHNQFINLMSFIKNAKYLGKIRSINAKFTTPHFLNNDIRYNRELHGGAFNDMAVYPLSLAIEICPNLKVTHINSNKKEFDVDVEGIIILEDSNVRAVLEYGFGYSYQNYAECVFENGIVKVDRPFSKPASYNNPIKVFQDMKLQTMIEYPSCNHFRIMFNKYWQNIIYQNVDPNLEKRLEQIRFFSNHYKKF
jgi:NDP-hexose-3-ketoreductase